MANWIGTARSNYVRVKDMEGLIAALEPFQISVSDDGKAGETHCFLSLDEYGAWPTRAWNDEDEEIELDWKAHVLPFLEPGQVLVLMEAGAEKLRYVTGWTTAYNTTTGEEISLALHDIYKLAGAAWPGLACTLAEY